MSEEERKEKDLFLILSWILAARKYRTIGCYTQFQPPPPPDPFQAHPGPSCVRLGGSHFWSVLWGVVEEVGVGGGEGVWSAGLRRTLSLVCCFCYVYPAPIVVLVADPL